MAQQQQQQHRTQFSKNILSAPLQHLSLSLTGSQPTAQTACVRRDSVTDFAVTVSLSSLLHSTVMMGQFKGSNDDVILL